MELMPTVCQGPAADPLLHVHQLANVLHTEEDMEQGRAVSHPNHKEIL